MHFNVQILWIKKQTKKIPNKHIFFTRMGTLIGNKAYDTIKYEALIQRLQLLSHHRLYFIC